MTIPLGFDKSRVKFALESSIHVGLAILLVASCLLILYPFLPLLTWGVLIAVSAYPAFKKLQSALGERGTLSAVLFTVVLLAALFVPVILLAETLVDAIQAIATRFKEGSLIIPPPPATVASWPIIGAPLNRLWVSASTDLTALIHGLTPQLKTIVPGVFSASAGLGLTVLQFALAIVVSGVLLANAQHAYEVTCSLCNRLFGDKGSEVQQMMGATIRSVTSGILGVAVIQTFFAGLSFLLFGLPGAGLWTVVFLIAAVLQVGALVLVPAVIYMFTMAGTTKAVIFLVWCLVVALMDNFLKPLLLGRGVAVPIAVVFLGAIGGFVTFGLIGLFIGAVLLSVGYKLFLAWLQEGSVIAQESP
jgi:predicted PurR-regulated permease PerM